MKKLFSILCILCMLAPSVSRWSAYVHCKIAEIHQHKDCGCDTIISASVPAEKDHAAPMNLVQQVFADWHFENPVNLYFSAVVFKPSVSFFYAKKNMLPKEIIQSIFHPPGC